MADIDLQQYNGTASFPATVDVGTNADPLLIPTDGPIVTADSNGANRAPVNKGTKRTKDLLLGIRDALVGDRAGAVRKTVMSLYADGFGGLTHNIDPGKVLAAGNVEAGDDVVSLAGDVIAFSGNVISQHNITSNAGDIVALIGKIQAIVGNIFAGNTATLEYSVLAKGFLAFVGTTATGSNPVRGTSIKNQLVAKSLIKHSGSVIKTGGTIVTKAGVGAWDAAIFNLGGAEPVVLRVTMTDAFDNTDYQVTFGSEDVAGTFNGAHLIKGSKTTTTFDIGLFSYPNTTINLTAVAEWGVNFQVIGQQTT